MKLTINYTMLWSHYGMPISNEINNQAVVQSAKNWANADRRWVPQAVEHNRSHDTPCTDSSIQEPS